MYSSSPPYNGVHIVLLILVIVEAAYFQDRGQGGVQCGIHFKEEKIHMMEYIAYFSSPSCDGGDSLLLALHCVQDDEK